MSEMFRMESEQAHYDLVAIFGGENDDPITPVKFKSPKLQWLFRNALRTVAILELLDATIHKRLPASQFEPTPRSKHCAGRMTKRPEHFLGPFRP